MVLGKNRPGIPMDNVASEQSFTERSKGDTLSTDNHLRKGNKTLELGVADWQPSECGLLFWVP